jgi:uncharacterized protein (DUF2141 family)
MFFAVLAPSLGGCSAAAAASPATPSPKAKKGTAKVRVLIKGFRNTKGQALVSLFDSSKGFPEKGDISFKREAVKVKEKTMELVFDQVPAGTYAVAILHDEDMDFKMKTGAFGIPKEGYGVSKNARGRFGPPKFEDAKFELKQDQTVALTISLVYH